MDDILNNLNEFRFYRIDNFLKKWIYRRFCNLICMVFSRMVLCNFVHLFSAIIPI